MKINKIYMTFTYDEIRDLALQHETYQLMIHDSISFPFVIDFNDKRLKLFMRQNTCQICGSEGVEFRLELKFTQTTFNLYAKNGAMLTFDHIVPKSLGGTNEESNGQCLCFSCNKKKGNLLNSTLREDLLFKEKQKAEAWIQQKN